MPAKYVRLYSKGEFGDYGREEPLIRDSGFRSVLVPSLDFIRCTFGQIRTDDHLRHQPIGAGRQTVSNARIHVEASDLEIDHGINVVLLLVERQPVLQRSEIGVILDPDRQIFAEIAREAGSRRE